MLAGIVLPLALVYRWGQVFPRLVPLLADRGMPRWLVLGPALGLGAGMTASDTVELHAATGGWDAARALFGTVRIRATATTAAAPVFLGIARAGAASGYLAGVAHATIYGPAGTPGLVCRARRHRPGGTAVPRAPVGRACHRAGTQTVVWSVRSGDWMVVAMNADGSRPVGVRVNVAATLPALPWLAGGLLAGGVIILAGGILLLVIPIRRASR